MIERNETMQMHRHGGDVYSEAYQIDFSANINPFGMPHNVKEAAWKGVTASINYPDIFCRELRKKLAEKINVPQEYLIFGNGAAELIFSLAAAWKPKKALVTAPGFAEYAHAVKVYGCEVEEYFLEEEEQFRIQNSYLERIQPDTHIVFLCNPNNPTGQVIEREFLMQVIQRCEKYGTLLVLDECFNEFLDEPFRYTMLPEIEKYKNLMILKAFTKIYGMPGLRLGYAICADEALLEKMREIVQPWNISVPAQFAGAAALDENEFVEKTRRLISTERKWMRKSLEKLKMQVFESHANYVFFKGPENLERYCKEQGMLIRDCSNYTGLTQGYYRVAVRTHEENERLIACIEKMMQER